MQRCQPFRALPLFKRTAGFEILQFSLPDVSDHDQRAIGAAKHLFFSEIERPLADLRGVVLNPNVVRSFRPVDILYAKIAAQNGFADFFGRTAELAVAGVVAAPLRVRPFAVPAYG